MSHVTHGNVFRVLTAGFALVTGLLVAATLFGVQNIRLVQKSAASIVREQAVTNHLIDELHSQQTSLSEVFSVLARDPDTVDYVAILNQLDEADRDIDRISSEGSQTPEHDLWAKLKQSSLNFSSEARRILAAEEPETFAPSELFREHEAFLSVVARLVEAEYHKVTAAQTQIDTRSSELLRTTLAFAAASLVLALVFAGITVRMVSDLIRKMEWQTTELGRVSWHMLEDQEVTARRFSHELHDELGQDLTAIKTDLSSLQPGQPVDAGRLADSLRLVDEAIGNVRQLSQLLRPTILDDFGLEAGLRWLAEGFATRTGIDVKFDSNYPGRLPDETETHLFRIAQEALTNVARHAGATGVRIDLKSDGGWISLSVEDNGRGLSGAAPDGRGMGMIGMRARARSAGGDITVHSSPGRGVLIKVEVPLVNEQAHTHPVS
ncbi:MAG TPA: sensor histidine kinase [Bryobacteraceae bacterium]|nr:sensor histidine kinase [Bryobacteraceae bacterium]